MYETLKEIYTMLGKENFLTHTSDVCVDLKIIYGNFHFTFGIGNCLHNKSEREISFYF